MTIEEKLVSKLVALTGKKVYLSKPVGDNDCVTYRRISTIPTNSIFGLMLEKARMQITVWGVDMSEVKSTVKEIIDGLNCDTDTFKTCMWADERCFVDQESKLIYSQVDFFVFD